MRYRPDLERLATLDAATIDVACTQPAALGGLHDNAVDEAIDFDERADDADIRGDAEHAVFCRQEAAAWRATAAVLRLMAAHPESADQARRGVA